MRSSTLAVVGAAILAGCGADQKAAEATNALNQFTNAASQMADQAQKMAEGLPGSGGAGGPAGRKPVDPVSFNVLIDYLPKSIPGLTAREPEGETTSAGQWQYSTAKVRFGTDGGGRSADVSVADFAHISMLYLPYRMALSMKIKRESTRGYERTVEVDGFPAFEKWEKANKDSEIAVLVGDRFVVTVETNGLDEGAARKIAEGMDLQGLAKQKAG